MLNTKSPWNCLAIRRLGLHTLAVNPGRMPGRELRSHQPRVCSNVTRRSRTQRCTLATPLTVSDTLREGGETAVRPAIASRSCDGARILLFFLDFPVFPRFSTASMYFTVKTEKKESRGEAASLERPGTRASCRRRCSSSGHSLLPLTVLRALEGSPTWAAPFIKCAHRLPVALRSSPLEYGLSY